MEELDPELSDRLCGVLTTLVALTPDTGRTVRGGLVFLVRE
ncbi:hypothetical protein [Actinocorallia populi]|nr:hypothetical protein [Actinocorallia populi]